MDKSNRALQLTTLGGYTAEKSLPAWLSITQKSYIRDGIFLETLLPNFKPGDILELGGAVGAHAAILRDLGREVVTSDVFEFFVEHMRSRGLTAYVIDALRISESIERKFDNVFAHGLSPLMVRKHEIVEGTYRSIHSVLKPSGRLVSVQSKYRWTQKRDEYYATSDHKQIIAEMGLFKIVRSIPHHVLPSGLYCYTLRKLFNWIDFNLAKIICNRHVLVLEKI